MTKGPPPPEIDERRPIRARGAGWAVAVAAWLARRGATPNAISIASVAFAVIGGVCIGASAELGGVGGGVLLASGAIWIALRSICNLLDGMVAVEHAKGTPSGMVFNDLPDRFSDIAFFVGAGAALLPDFVGFSLGVACALGSLLTAYVRVLGASQGLVHDFSGPMAKPHRMGVLALGCLAGGIEAVVRDSTYALLIALCVVLAGVLITVVRRTRRLISDLERRA